MGQKVHRVLEMERSEEVKIGTCVGRIDRVESSGDVFVDFQANDFGPIHARLATTKELNVGEQVLLVFENGNAKLPIVVGALRAGLDRARPSSLALEATSEITITCGKSSIMLRNDGRIVVKGTELVSRASRTNKIRGSAVEIN